MGDHDGCEHPGTLVRRALSGGPWIFVASAASTSVFDPDDLVATQAGIAAVVVVGRYVLVTGNGGITRTMNPDGDAGTLAATTSGRLAIATQSAASWLYYSPDAGASWQTVNQQDDGGGGWADLGFTTATDGVVVRGPADSDGNSTQRPGQLLLTGDAGASWHQVRF